MLKRFSKYVFQSVAGMMGMSVYILADTFFISISSGADGLAVLNLILPVFGMMYAIGSMIGIGSATRYGISKAKGEDADHYFMQSVCWTLLCSIPFILTGIFVPDKFLALLGADAGLVELGKTYLRIVLVFAPFFMCNYSVTAFARNDNATSTVMAGSLAGSAFNIVFDYIFIFPAGLGFSGAALATAFCPIVTMLTCSKHYLSKKCNIGFKWKKLSLRHLISCCQLGVSAFVGEISSAVLTFIFNMLILGLTGSTGVAAYGVVANLSLVGMAIMNGMAQGAQPMISEYYGRGAADAVKKLLGWALKSVVVVEIVMVALVWIFTDPFIAVFNSENNQLLLEYAHTGLRLYFLGFLFAGVNIMLVAYFSATANARPAIIGSLLRGAIAIGICAIVLSRVLGMNGVWLSFLASEMITLAVILILSKHKESRKTNEYA
ncbi:MATE family efflux transporter [Blautia sp. MSJ-19]|uniref:MATE family efflux transporter n=1 Tax=Blautia sp. MSJ-19 TaxID=2841517 RepID=UPI001C0EFD44|nr:MATE family efflux transporter [Blautia sp. MSJ-19]MBU5480251.1 MATE family efflux transporter [Blautia sp. MSJ-19]